MIKMIKLNNGVEMPQEGFGVYQIPDATQCEQSVVDALVAGYRSIDTAAVYGNEEAVGEAIRKSKIARKELFITTKLWIQDAGYDNAKAAFAKSLRKLGLNYLDLYLVHQPVGDYYGSWRAMEELYKEGKIKAIGVSNFYPDRLVDLCLNSKVVPAVNQIELHPLFQQGKAIKTMNEFGVKVESWGPLAEGAKELLQNEMLATIAKKYNKTVAQIALRWQIELGIIIIPKSTHKERIIENIQVWDFSLDSDDMEKIAQLDLGYSPIIDHHAPETIRMLNGIKIHN